MCVSGIKKMSCGLTLLNFIFISSLMAETTLFDNYDNGAGPNFCINKEKAVISEKNKAGITYPDGKWGKGVRVERNMIYPLAYKFTGLFSPENGGAVEFWYRPEWDCKDILDSGEKYLVGLPIRVQLFTTEGEGSGIILEKTQYNVLQLSVWNRYNTKCWVGTPADTVFKKGEWVHIAAAWDKNDARLFVNGKLAAISADLEWDTSLTAYWYNLIGFGGRAGAGTFDELIISNNKKYIASFPVLQKPFDPVAKETVSSPAGLPQELGKKYSQTDALFDIGFSKRLTADFALGNPAGWTNRSPQIEKFENNNYLRLKPRIGEIGDILCFETSQNYNPFSGKLCLVLRPSGEKQILPAILFECCKKLPLSRGDFGIRLILNSRSELEWQIVEASKVVKSVKSAAISLLADRDCQIEYAWTNGMIRLAVDGKEVAVAHEIPVPCIWEKYFYIGSGHDGTDAFDGWIKSVSISLNNQDGALKP